jgi:hypothetical protein
MTRVLIGIGVILAIMISIPVLLAWSQSRRRLRVERQGDAVVLRMPRGHWALLSVVALMPFAGLSTAAFLATWAPGNEGSGLFLGGLMAFAGVTFGGYLMLLEWHGCIRLDDTTIELVGALRRRSLPWSAVAKLTFNPVNNWFFVTGPDGKTVYFVEGLNGIADFAEVALRRLPPKVLKASPDAVEVMEQLIAS